METQIEAGRSKQMARQQVVRPGYKWFLVALAALSVGMITAILFVRLPSTNQQSNRQRAIEAESARYSGLAEFYLAEQKATAQRAREAEAACYRGLAAYYTAKEEANRQRAIEAEAARYTGLAEFYMADQK